MKPGEMVLVNAAAGAVGSVVGQLAKIGVSGLNCSYLLIRRLTWRQGNKAMNDQEGKHP